MNGIDEAKIGWPLSAELLNYRIEVMGRIIKYVMNIVLDMS